MQDRFSFRGKAVSSLCGLDKQGEWIIGQGVVFDKSGAVQIWRQMDEGTWNYSADPATVGQCTGVRDKNGELIFEGDIVKITFAEDQSAKGPTGKVCWNDCLSMWCVFDFAFDVPAYLYGHNSIKRLTTKYEIIGNIHDNPEMMEGE